MLPNLGDRFPKRRVTLRLGFSAEKMSNCGVRQQRALIAVCAKSASVAKIWAPSWSNKAWRGMRLATQKGFTGPSRQLPCKKSVGCGPKTKSKVPPVRGGNPNAPNRTAHQIRPIKNRMPGLKRNQPVVFEREKQHGVFLNLKSALTSGFYHHIKVGLNVIDGVNCDEPSELKFVFDADLF